MSGVVVLRTPGVCREMTPIGSTSSNVRRSQRVLEWDYLYERDPRLLRWIVEHQAPHSRWAEYPVLGEPVSPPAPPAVGARQGAVPSPA